MPTSVIMPALGIAQDTGTVVSWLKEEGAAITKGEPLLEIETDKATVEIEAPKSGILSDVTALAGDTVPVGEVIALILEPGESVSALPEVPSEPDPPPLPESVAAAKATPVAARIAEEHGIDLSSVKPKGSRITKEDVLAHIHSRVNVPTPAIKKALPPASPKARRLASESGKEIATIQGSGPGGAVLSADVLKASEISHEAQPQVLEVSKTWYIMAERTTQSWTRTPHFFLLREVSAERLVAWKVRLDRNHPGQITYTDLLVKLVAASLVEHPRLNARWEEGTILLCPEINVGLAVATDDGLVVPVMERADQKNLREITAWRRNVVTRSQTGQLRPQDLAGGTFTISNLGMYDVDAANAVINPPQAAILAIGRIAPRVVAVEGQPKVLPTMVLSLSCDHRVVDGARAARFLRTLVDLIEEPLGLITT